MSVEDDKKQLTNSLGYEPRYFAHKHRISRAEANEIIERVGQDRTKLDEAARELKRSRSKGTRL